MNSQNRAAIQKIIEKFDLEKEAYNQLTVFLRGQLSEFGICRSSVSHLFDADIEDAGRLLKSVGRPRWMPPDVYSWICEELVVPPWLKYLVNCERHFDEATNFVARTEFEGEEEYYVELADVGSLCVYAARLLLEPERDAPMSRTCAGPDDELDFEIDEIAENELAKEIGDPPYYCCRNIGIVFKAEYVPTEAPETFNQRPFDEALNQKEKLILEILGDHPVERFTAQEILSRLAPKLDENETGFSPRNLEILISGLIEKGIAYRPPGRKGGVAITAYGEYLSKKINK